MIRAFLLLLSCVSMLAQRTPLKVNGTVINNPNLTNSATVTYSVNGANISATAAGGGGDTIWTNDNGTISATSEAAAGVEAFKMDTSIAHTSGNLFEINNNGVDVLYVSWDGAVSTAGSLASFYADDGTGYITVDAYGQFGIEVSPGYTAKLSLYPTDPDGGVPYDFNTTVTHTGGNLVELKNNDVDVFNIDYTGKVAAVAGFGSTASDAAVTIASTGWTNTFGKNAVVYMDGVGLTYTVYDNALTPVYTNSVTVVNATVILQPSGKVIITDGTLGVGRATPF